MRKQEDVMKDIERVLNEKMLVCVFGVGKVGTGKGQELLKMVGVHADFYCDNNEKRWGEEIETGVFCVSPDDIIKYEKKACFVMIGQFHQEKVLEQVKNMGFDIVINYGELCSLDVIVDKFFECSEKITEQEFYIKRKTLLEKREEKEYQVPNLKNKKIAVYTCISGNYDNVVEPEVISEECDYYLISDNNPGNLKIFQWIDINKIVPEWVTDNPRRNRYCKINVSKIFASYPYSIYIDGNVKIVGEITKYINVIGKSGFANHLHAYNNCLYVEAIRVIAVKVEDEKLAKMQMVNYREEGMPRNYGEFQNAILVRENNNFICKKLMEDWWREVFTKSYRDQLSLTYCLWKNGIEMKDVGVLGENMRKNKDFVWVSRHHV